MVHNKVIYGCGCTAAGDNVSEFCPMHGDHIYKKTNTGYKGHYWTKVMSLGDMKATDADIERYYEQKQY